jgi:hypothetical protein
MDPRTLQAWWSHRQGLDDSLQGRPAAEVLERSGWARSVGGVGPYLTLFARAGSRRAAADAAVADLQIHELPAARNCTYVVPASDFALALAVGRPFSESAMKQALKLGVTEEEVERLCAAVLDALADGAPMSPDALRAATGNASRSLGEEGKKKGITTTLPIALGRLQARGQIRRVPANGRLDQQRYLYARWSPSPAAAGEPTPDDAFTTLAHRFFRWVGPATTAEFQWFSGLGVKAAGAALAPLGLVPVGDDRLLLPEDVDAFRAFQAPTEPRYALVSSLDAISAARRDVLSLLDPQHRDHPAALAAGLRAAGNLADLPNHAILDRGRLIGLWEYDPAEAAIVWTTFDRAHDAELLAAIRATEDFIRDDLGDARSYSLDAPKSRAGRIEALRAGA